MPGCTTPQGDRLPSEGHRTDVRGLRVPGFHRRHDLSGVRHRSGDLRDAQDGAVPGAGVVPARRDHPRDDDQPGRRMASSTADLMRRSPDGHVAQWIEGARPRTLPNAVAPVIAGTGAAAWLDAAVWWKALLALAVAVALIVGVNYANDYSDGIAAPTTNAPDRCDWSGRRWPSPRAVLAAAVASLASAAVAGLVLAMVHHPVAHRGRRCVHRRGMAVHRRVEALRVSGARRGRGVRVLRPGGRAGHAVHPGAAGRLGGAGAGGRDGLLSSAVLVANNLRDIPTVCAVRQDHAGRPARRRANAAAVSGCCWSVAFLTVVLVLATPWCLGAGGHPTGGRAAGPVDGTAVGKD